MIPKAYEFNMRNFSPWRILVLLAALAVHSICPLSGANAARVKEFLHTYGPQFIKENKGTPVAELIVRADRCRHGGSIDSAAAYYSVAAGRYSESLNEKDKRKCAIAAVNLGYILLGWEMDPSSAYPWLIKADSIARAYGFDDIRTSVKSNLGRMYFDYNNYPKAAKYLKEVLAEVMAQKTDKYFGMSFIDFTASSLFGQEYLLRGAFAEEAIHYKLGGDMPLARYIGALRTAISKYNAGDPAGGAAIMMNSRNLIDIDSERDLYYVMHAIITGKFLMAAGDYRQATDILSDELISAKAEGYYNLLEKCYSMLIECARHSGDNEAAARYRYKALEIRDSLFNAAGFETVKDIEKAAAIEELRDENTAVNIRAARRLRFTVIAVFAVLIIAGLLFWFYKGRRLRKDSSEDISDRRPESDGEPAGESEVMRKERGESHVVSDDSCVTEMPDEATRELFDRIKAFLESSDSVYSADFSVETLAEGIGSKPKAVSQAINQIAGMNFNTFIGPVRVEKACKILSDPEKMKTMTIESVAESVGYRSRTHFNKVFKEITGQTPSQFARRS